MTSCLRKAITGRMRKLKKSLDNDPKVCYIITMMNDLDTFKEDMAIKLFGRSKVLAVAGNQCVKCGEGAVDFRDELSRKEFNISGFCQKCQDEIFGGPDGDDDKDEVLGEVHQMLE